MPDLRLPNDIEITALPLVPWYPGLVRHQGPFTPKRDYYFHNPGAWRGSVTIGELEANPAAIPDALAATELSYTAAEINGIIAGMRAGARTLALPMQGVGPTIEEPANATTVTAIDSDGTLTLSNDAAIPNGSWFRLEERIFVARGAQPAPDKVVVEPVYVAAIGDALHMANEIIVRLDDQLPLPPHDASWWGPWIIPFVEAV